MGHSNASNICEIKLKNLVYPNWTAKIAICIEDYMSFTLAENIWYQFLRLNFIIAW